MASKALIQRVTDVCAGAGMVWRTDICDGEVNGWWEYQEDCTANIDRARTALCDVFNIQCNSVLNKISFLDKWTDPDTLAEFIKDIQRGEYGDE